MYQNLHNSFPEKTNIEIRGIARKFYHNLSDLVFEQIKIRGISKEQCLKRMVFKNTGILEDLHKKNKSVIGLIGHTGNWVWVGIFFFLGRGGAAPPRARLRPARPPPPPPQLPKRNRGSADQLQVKLIVQLKLSGFLS